jgi:hypothetical protein
VATEEAEKSLHHDPLSMLGSVAVSVLVGQAHLSRSPQMRLVASGHGQIPLESASRTASMTA